MFLLKAHFWGWRTPESQLGPLTAPPLLLIGEGADVVTKWRAGCSGGPAESRQSPIRPPAPSSAPGRHLTGLSHREVMLQLTLHTLSSHTTMEHSYTGSSQMTAPTHTNLDCVCVCACAFVPSVSVHVCVVKMRDFEMWCDLYHDRAIDIES